VQTVNLLMILKSGKGPVSEPLGPKTCTGEKKTANPGDNFGVRNFVCVAEGARRPEGRIAA